MVRLRHVAAAAALLSATACAVRLRGDAVQPGGGIFDRLISSAGSDIELVRSKEGWYVAKTVVDGTPVRLAVDTGSEVFWVRSATLAAGAQSASESVAPSPAKNASGGHLGGDWAFVNADSAPHFSVQYGRGHVAGEVRSSAVQLKEDEKAHSCQVGRATDQTGIWAKQQTIDGVLGLACGGGEAGSLRCLFPQELAEVQPEHVITMQLTKDGGKLVVGSVPAEYRASLYFMPPARVCGKWTAPLLALSAATSGAMEVFKGLQKPSEALLDSGTMSIVGPTFDVIALARTLGATPAPAKDGYGGEVSFYNIPCAAQLTLPPVTLTLGAWGQEANVTLTGKELVSEGSEDSETCRLRIAGWETESWILGVAFIEHLRGMVYDLDKHMVGLSL